MVKQSYPGLMFPARDLEALRPLRDTVIRLKSQCRPFGHQYMALDRLRGAIDECAAELVQDGTFFHRKPPKGNGC